MKRIFIALFLSLLAINSPASLAGELASLSIISQQTGQSIKIWRHAGRNYIVGTNGERNSLKIKNKLDEPILSVIAVDGINVITGDTASPDQAGYVFEADQQQEIAGWRKSMHEVAEVYFADLSNSYAARTGRRAQVGVIGIALFREKKEIALPLTPEARRKKAYDENYAKGSQRRESSPPQSGEFESEDKLGTGHGERIRSETTTTKFVRARKVPNEVLTLYYDSYANLVARGIIPKHLDHPAPFPKHFVPDPH